jgi:hypothetical protein
MCRLRAVTASDYPLDFINQGEITADSVYDRLRAINAEIADSVKQPGEKGENQQ